MLFFNDTALSAERLSPQNTIQGVLPNPFGGLRAVFFNSRITAFFFCSSVSCFTTFFFGAGFFAAAFFFTGFLAFAFVDFVVVLALGFVVLAVVFGLAMVLVAVANARLFAMLKKDESLWESEPVRELARCRSHVL